MAKLLIKAAGLFLFGIAFVGTASAVELRVDAMETPTYAAEIFGEGSDDVVLEYGDEGNLHVYLLLPYGAGGAPMVDPDDVNMTAMIGGCTDSTAFCDIVEGSDARITISVHGAVFAESVRGSDLSLARYRFRANSMEDNPLTEDVVESDAYTDFVDAAIEAGEGVVLIDTKNREGGSIGDDYVSLDIEVLNGDIMGGKPDMILAPDGGEPLTAIYALRLELPALTEAAQAMGPLGKGVRVSMELGANRRDDETFPEFPTTAQRREGMHQIRVIPPTWTTEKESTTPHPAVVARAGPGDVNVKINSEDRTMAILPVARSGLFNRLATLTVNLDEGRLGADGESFSVNNRTGSGSGDAIVTVAGNVREDDVFAWDLNGDMMADNDEMLDVQPGLARGFFQLDGLLLDNDGDYDEEAGSGALLYFPNGKDPMRDGVLAVGIGTVFDEDTHRSDVTGGRGGPDLVYSAGTPIEAYALAPMASGDETNVRIRCGRAFACTVYISCDATDGTNFYGKMADKIAPWSVQTVNSGMIGEIVGADDADFMGRMSCDVIGATEIQVLTRSGGVLVNNSFVGGAN